MTSRDQESQHQRTYLLSRRIKAKAYLGSKCVTCGNEDGLEFDHIDPGTKVIEVSTAIAKHWAWSKLVTELDKCQLLCIACHRSKTAVDLGYETDSYSIECPTCTKAFVRQKRNMNGAKAFCSRSCSTKYYGRVTQLAECFPYTEEVGDSSSSVPT